MNQEINPEAGVLKNVFGDDPNQNGGMPVMSEETIANAQLPEQPDDTLYTFDNGEYKPQMDILYPPGTKFYFKREDGTYYGADVEIGPDAVSETPVAITEEFMIEKSTEFLRAHGFSVVPAGEVPTQSVKLEISMGLTKLKQIIASHSTNHKAIGEAHAIIAGIEKHL